MAASGRFRGLVLTSMVLGALLALSGCTPPLGSPGDTGSISLIRTTRADGWRFDTYRNTRYPCSISGHHTFTVGRRVGTDPTATAPLWTWMHGGGVGFFDAGGNPQPDEGNMREESAQSQQDDLAGDGLFRLIRSDPASFRMLAVSYCNRDLYAGAQTVDPNNPHRLPDGSARRTNGLLATKAAVQFVQERYPTSETFLHGGSAGSVGTFNVAWALEEQGIPPAGVVADASIVNREAMSAIEEQDVCGAGGRDRSEAVEARVHPELADIDNEVDRLVTRGDLTVPLMHVWDRGDNVCGLTPVVCPLRDGTTASMSITDCLHEPLRAAIAAEGPASRSANLPLCVDDVRTPGRCDQHVVTTHDGLVNTRPASPSDYLGAIMGWVHARLDDR